MFARFAALAVAAAVSGITSCDAAYASHGAVIFRPARLRNDVLAVASAPTTTDKLALLKWAERSDERIDSSGARDDGAAARDDAPTAAVGWHWRAVLLALSALWASNPVAVKMIFDAAPELQVSEIMALRFGLAAVALLPFLVKNMRTQRQAALTGAEIGAWIMLGYGGQMMGLLTTTASKSAFINSLSVVWVAIASGVLNRTFETRVLLCTALAVAGVGYLELAGSHGPPVIGDLWSMAQPLFFGWGYIRLEQSMAQQQQPGDEGGADGDGAEDQEEAAITLSASKVLVCALASAAWATADGGGAGMDLHLDAVLASGTATAALLWMGLVTTAGALAFETEVFKWVPATDASVIMSAQPLMAAAIAYVTLHESFGVTDAIGGALIVAACVLNEALKNSASTATGESPTAGSGALTGALIAEGLPPGLMEGGVCLLVEGVEVPGLSLGESVERWVCSGEEPIGLSPASHEVFCDGDMVVACAY